MFVLKRLEAVVLEWGLVNLPISRSTLERFGGQIDDLLEV